MVAETGIFLKPDLEIFYSRLWNVLSYYGEAYSREFDYYGFYKLLRNGV